MRQDNETSVRKLGVNGMKAAASGRRVGGSLAVGTIVQRRKGKIISPFHHQKIKVYIYYKPKWNG